MYFLYIKKETIITIREENFYVNRNMWKIRKWKKYFSRRNKKKYPEKTIHIDIDKIGHYILEIQEVKIELIRHFKKNILTNNKIDRKKLSKIVFKDPHEMDILSEITWRHIERLIEPNNRK